MVASLSLARPRRRSPKASTDGGKIKMPTACGNALHLLGALPVDFPAGCRTPGDSCWRDQRSEVVIVAIYLGMLQENPAGNHCLEGGTVNKMIVFTMHFAIARRAGGVRHRRLHTLVSCQQGGHQRGLARAGRRGDDQNVSRFAWREFLKRNNHRGNRSG